jgi:hypothetical protein
MKARLFEICHRPLLAELRRSRTQGVNGCYRQELTFGTQRFENFQPSGW